MNHVGVLGVLAEEALIGVGDNLLAVDGDRDAIDGLLVLTILDDTGQHHLFGTRKSAILHDGAERAECLQALVAHVHVERLLHGQGVVATLAEQ